MTTIYRKTAKGRAEVETRAHRLPPRLRAVLIVVDGQRTPGDLAKLIPGDVDGALQQLMADGFIDVFAVLADRPPLPPPPATAGVAKSIDTTKRDAVRYLIDKMGPAAEGLAIKIERAKTEAELRPLLAQAVAVLRNLGGAALSDAFASRFIDTPPSA
jgi:hypothetical protein